MKQCLNIIRKRRNKNQLRIKFTKTILLILALGFILYLFFSKLNLTVIKAEYHKNYESIYPSKCFVKFENRKYLIRNIYKYHFKILIENWSVGMEDFAVKKSIGKENPLLKFQKSDSKIGYNSHEYKISEVRKDTVISKINDDEIMIFVD